MKRLFSHLYLSILTCGILIGTGCSTHELTEPADMEISAKSSSSVDFDELLGLTSSSSQKATSSSSSKKESSSSNDKEENQINSSKSSSSTSAVSSSSEKESTDKDDEKETVTTSSSSSKVPSSSSKETIVESSSSSEKSSSSTIIKSSSSVEVTEPVEVNVKVNDCQNINNESGQLALNIANDNAADMIEAAYKGHLKDLQNTAELAKTQYGKILKVYPSSCAAKFGYALSTIANITNDPEVSKIIDDYKIYAPDNILKCKGEELKNALVRITNNLSREAGEPITKQVQRIVAKKVLPAIDTSIAYMKSILSEEDYTIRIEANGVTREFDQSEFAPVLGSLYALKASFTALASINIEIDNNKTYNWIHTVVSIDPTSSYYLSETEGNALNTLLALIDAESPFTSVYSSWEDKWATIPDLMDSALSQTKAGFEYGLYESRLEGSQTYDVYVVGDGYDADVSRKDIQTLIDSIDSFSNMLNTPSVITYRNASTTVNIRELFKQTSGFIKFLPYYTYEDASDLSTYYFTNVSGKKTCSFVDFLDGPYSAPKDGYGRIIFPDPTFGGIFPDLTTNSKLWNFLKNF